MSGGKVMKKIWWGLMIIAIAIFIANMIPKALFCEGMYIDECSFQMPIFLEVITGTAFIIIACGFMVLYILHWLKKIKLPEDYAEMALEAMQLSLVLILLGILMIFGSP